MTPMYSVVALLPLILSNSVRYRLNFGRSIDTTVSCSLTKTELIVVTEMISRSRMDVDEESLAVLRILETCFPANTNCALQLWKWRVGLPPKDSIINSVNFVNSAEYYTSSMLQHVAEDDDRDIYEKWKKRRMLEYLRKSLGSMTDTDVAEFVSVFLDGTWVWNPNGKEGVWYHFNRSLWCSQVHETLPRVMSTKVQRFLERFMERLTADEMNLLLDSNGRMVDSLSEVTQVDSEMSPTDDDMSSRSSLPTATGQRRQRASTKKPKYTSFGDRMCKLKEGFQLVGFKNKIMKELKEVLCVNNFATMLDRAPDRLPIMDGVILVRSDRVDVCRMRMQHMCSMSTKQYLLRHKMSEKHPMVLKVHK